jgi:ADP-heptose:LPS heptosyltransferase
MDLIISVDTFAAHLAGALAVPTWVLLPFAADWRWMLQRSDSPWYPSMRLWRQESPGDWYAVVEKIRPALTTLLFQLS